MKRIILVVTIISFLLLSCDKDSKNEIILNNGSLEQLEYYNNNQVKSRSLLNEDSVRNGKSVEYFKSGGIRSVCYFKQGKRDSVMTEYFENGEVRSITFWNYGKQYRGQVEFFKNVKDEYFTLKGGDTVKITEPMRKSFSFFDLEGHKVYERQYDQSGELVMETGEIIAIVGNSDLNISEKDTVRLDFYMVDPKWVDHYFRVNLLNSKMRLIEYDSLLYDEGNGAFFYHKRFDQAGDYYIQGIGKMKDQLFDNINIDTVEFKVSVKDKYDLI